MNARIIALGNIHAQDDGAAIVAAKQLASEMQVVLAGRPGATLLDLLAGTDPVVVADVVRSGLPGGEIVCYPLSALTEGVIPDVQLSSHGFGPAETLQLGSALGRTLPPGYFVGIEGERFGVGQDLSPPVLMAMNNFVDAIRKAANAGGQLRA